VKANAHGVRVKGRRSGPAVAKTVGAGVVAQVIE
jgi:hypothetical protein